MVYGFLKKWAKRDNKNTRWIIKDGMKKLSREKQDEIIAVLT
jgi:3-methyladenine DNA glycosylase AlkC